MEPMANDISALPGWRVNEGEALKCRSRKPDKEIDKELAEALIRRLCHLLDAEDFFGRHQALSAKDKIARQFLASLDDKNQSDFNCAVSPKVRLQVPLLFQAIAGVMEEKSGILIQSSAEINGEGFGRALLYSGRIILVLKSLRAGFPFPFTSEDKVVRYAVTCVEEGLSFLEHYYEMIALYGSLSLEG